MITVGRSKILSDSITISCPICECPENAYLGPYRSKHGMFDGTSKVSCINCGLVFANPMPEEKEITRYNSSYFNVAHGGLTNDPHKISFFTGIAKIRANYISNYLIKNKLKVKKILEIGPGQGFFASNWINNNPDVEYSVVETDNSCFSYLEKLGIKIMPSLDPVRSVKKDLIVMSHVLEHVSNPKAFLSSASKWLSLKGVLFIEVPCRDYMHKKIDEPHLLFFDKHSLVKLLENAGYKNIQITYHGKSLSSLKLESYFTKKLLTLRQQLISLGLLFPFCRFQNGLEFLNPLEISVLKPFEAHVQSEVPSWWIRAIAMKVDT